MVRPGLDSLLSRGPGMRPRGRIHTFGKNFIAPSIDDASRRLRLRRSRPLTSDLCRDERPAKLWCASFGNSPW